MQPSERGYYPSYSVTAAKAIKRSGSFRIDTNAAPQDHKLNSGIWSKLKKRTRNIALTKNDLYVVTGYADRHNCHVLFLSGRDGCCYAKTYDWLVEHVGHNVSWSLNMRKTKDFRKDSIVKEELFWDIVAPNFNVVGVFDDRPQVLQMWHELKLPNVICVGNPFNEF